MDRVSKTLVVEYDETIYRGCARHYLKGRPPYSADLGSVLQRALGLDGSGHLLDVGCGPAVLAVQLASLFEHVTAIDPDPDMVAEARTHADSTGTANVEVLTGRAEDLPNIELPSTRLVTFGQSFHWTDRDAVAQTVYDLLAPGGAIALIAHDIDASVQPHGTGDPPIPDDEVQEIIRRYLGPNRRAGTGLSRQPPDRFEDVLARTRFGRPDVLYAPGRPDITRDIDGVISGYLSMSYAAPHLFGDQLGSFIAEVRQLLAQRTTTGRFWDWPGDTVAVVGHKGA